MRNSQLKIFNQTNDFNSLIYKPNRFVTFDSIIKEIARSDQDIFAFYGDDEEIKIAFHDQGIDLIRFHVTDSLNISIKHRLFLLGLETEEREFNLLCKVVYDYVYDTSNEYKPTLHKLKYVGDKKWILVHTFDINIYITRYLKSNIIDFEILDLLADENSSDFIIFRGESSERTIQGIN